MKHDGQKKENKNLCLPQIAWPWMLWSWGPMLAFIHNTPLAETGTLV